MIASPVRPGDLIEGKYRVERVLGAGGMGVVVAAMHIDLQQRVAIKLLLARTAEQAERLLREARAAVRLRSEHAAKVIDVGRLPDGTPFLVLEYLEGRDLDDVIAREGSLTPRRAAGYLVQACEAIAEAHSLGIVHRDLKPQNLFLLKGLGGEDIVKVLDFGIAKTAGYREESVLTSEQSLVGSPVYMPPEQIRSARNVMPQGDIWALGVTLQELVTGRTPFEGESLPDLCLSIARGEPRSPLLDRPDLPAEMVAIIARCLAREPSARYAHAGELATALESLAPPESSFSASRARLLTGMRSHASERTLGAETPASVQPAFQSRTTLEPLVPVATPRPTQASLGPFASTTSGGPHTFADPLTQSSFPPIDGPSRGVISAAKPTSGGAVKLLAVASMALVLVVGGWLVRHDDRTPPSAAVSPTIATGTNATFPSAPTGVVRTSLAVEAIPMAKTEPVTSISATTARPSLGTKGAAGAGSPKPSPKRPPTQAGDDIPSMR